MRRKLVFVVAVFGAAVVWVGAAAQQQTQPRPGPGTGVMDVRVINHPAVTAAQSGTWEVGLSRTADVRVINNPSVTVSRPSFVEMNTTYRITWPDGGTETARIVGAGGGGWVQVSSEGSARWINLDQARAVDKTR